MEQLICVPTIEREIDVRVTHIQGQICENDWCEDCIETQVPSYLILSLKKWHKFNQYKLVGCGLLFTTIRQDEKTYRCTICPELEVLGQVKKVYKYFLRCLHSWKVSKLT